MMTVYGAGAVTLALMGQQSAEQLLDAALKADPSTSGVMEGARQLAAVGVDMPTAAVVVAGSGLAYKLLQMATPFTQTLNDKLRQRWGVDGKPPVSPPG